MPAENREANENKFLYGFLLGSLAFAAFEITRRLLQ